MTANGAWNDVVLLLTQTLLHFLWQGAVLGLIAATLSLVLQRRARAQTWWSSQLAVFALMLLCPFITAALLTSLNNDDPLPQLTVSLQDGYIVSGPQPITSFSEEVFMADPAEAAPITGDTQADLAALPILVEYEDEGPFERAAPFVSAVYAAGVALMLLRLLLGVRGGRRLRASAQEVTDAALLAAIDLASRALRFRRTPVVALSARVAVATVVGFVRPIVLLPMHIQIGFTPAQIEMLLLHEFAHLRRYDHWVALLQRLGEALLFFHPAVWYVSRQISAAREHCCDDLVLGLGKTPVDYAKTLLHAGEQATVDPTPALAALHAVKAPSQLRRRIARMLRSELPVKAAPSRLTMFLVVMLIAGSVIAVAATTQNEKEEQATQESAKAVAEPIKLESAPTEEPPIVVAQNTTETGPQATPPPMAEQQATAQREMQLIGQLKSGDPWVSKLAALEMGRSGSSGFVPLLTSLLSNETAPPEARAAAAEALGMLSDPRGVPYLVSALRHYNSDVAPIAVSAAKALATINDPSVLRTIQIALNDEALKTGAYHALQQIGTEETIAILMDKGLSDADSEASLCLAILQQSGRDLLPSLIRVLNGDDPVRAQEALRALALAREPDALMAIGEALENRKLVPNDGTVSIFFANQTIDSGYILQTLTDMLLEGKLDSLGQGNRERLGQQIISSAELPQEPERQAALYVAIGSYHLAPTFGAAAVPPLIRALAYERDSQHRLQVIAALGSIGDPRAIPALEKEFGVVRERSPRTTDDEAVIAVAAIGTKEAIPPLVRALSNPRLSTRIAAANALGNFRDAQAVDALILTVRQLDESVRQAAVLSLGKIKDARAVPALATALNDASQQVYPYAAEALGRIGTPDAVDALINALKTTDNSRVYAIAAALKLAGDSRAVPPLQEAQRVFTDTNSASVIRDALAALQVMQ